MTLFLILGLALLAVLLWLGNGVRKIGAVSDGTVIGHRDGTALVLIDLQDVFWEDGPYSEQQRAAAEDAILAEIQSARVQDQPVIALRQEWSIPSTKAVARLTMGGQALEGTPGTDLARPFADLPDHVLVKRVQDGFETGELDVLLENLNVGRLRIVGLDLSYCVLKTALAARARGFEVTLVRRGVLAASASDQVWARLEAQGVTVA